LCTKNQERNADDAHGLRKNSAFHSGKD
jgi:hypothetical protein